MSLSSLISSLSPLYGIHESAISTKRYCKMRTVAKWMSAIWACTHVALAITKILAPHHQIRHEFYGIVQLTITIPLVWSVFQMMTSALYITLHNTTTTTKTY